MGRVLDLVFYSLALGVALERNLLVVEVRNFLPYSLNHVMERLADLVFYSLALGVALERNLLAVEV